MTDPALPACAGRGLGWHEVLPARNLCRNHCNIFVQLFFLSFTGTWKFYDSSGISGCFRHSEHRIGSFIYCGTPMGHPRCSICNSHRTVCFRNRHHIVCTSQMPGSTAVITCGVQYLLSNYIGEIGIWMAIPIRWVLADAVGLIYMKFRGI